MYIELIISASFKNTEIISWLLSIPFFSIWFMINKDINNYIDLLPRNFQLSILVAVHISSKFCLVIIIHSKMENQQFFPQ